jgi:hypothetical protein
MSKTTNIIILSILAAGIAMAGISGSFSSVASSSYTGADPLTGREITFFTNSSNITFPKPDRNIWTASNDFILFESDMSRPSGTPSGDGEKQLIAANVSNGNFYWIAPLEVEDPFIYGGGHFNIPADAHFACSKENDLVVYRDITGHRLYLKRLGDNTTIQLLHLFAGTFLGTPAISDDGSVVVIQAIHGGPDTDFYDNTVRSVIRFDIDVENMQVVGGAEAVMSFAGRRANLSQPAEKLGEPVLSADGSWIAFNNETTDLSGNKSHRLLLAVSDGSALRTIAKDIPQAGGLWCDGDDLYFVANGGFARANINSSGYQQWRRLLTDRGMSARIKGKKASESMPIPIPMHTVGMDSLMLIDEGFLVYNTLPLNYDTDGLGATVIYGLNTKTTDKQALVSARQGSSSGQKTNFHICGNNERIVYSDFTASESKIGMFSLE